MGGTTRRSFLQAGALGAGAVACNWILPEGWLTMARGEANAYFESGFGITDNLCHRLLEQALSKGGDYADLYFEHKIVNALVLEDGQVNQAYGSVDLGVGIRTVKGDQVGYAFTQDLTEAAMLAAAATAATIASAAAGKVAPQFVPVQGGCYYPPDTLFSAVPVSAKLPLVQAVNDKCFARSKLVAKVNCGLRDEQKAIMVVTSDGQKAADLMPRSALYASVVAEKDGRREQARWDLGGRRWFSFFTPEVVDRVVEKVIANVLTLFEAVQPPAGEMPVVLGPGVTGVLLHEAIGHGMEADFSRKKISTYATMLGKRVAEPFVTIVDDGTNPNLTGSINFDDEATVSQKTVLVDRGTLTGYLHDRISARHYQVPPTGNGRRESYRHYPVPRMRNTYMLPGPASPDDVIKSVKHGIYVQEVSNGQVKIGEGDFAFYVSQGRMIENGRLTAPIKDMNIMGNGPKMLLNVGMVANDLQMAENSMANCGKDGQSVPVSFGMPTVLVHSMTVGGTKQQGAGR
jgi:TldD protein